MKNYSKNDIVLVRYPFSDLLNSKVRPAVIINAPHASEDIFIVPLTSKTISLFPGEFILKDWEEAGLNVVTAIKRGIYTISKTLVIKSTAIPDAMKFFHAIFFTAIIIRKILCKTPQKI